MFVGPHLECYRLLTNPASLVRQAGALFHHTPFSLGHSNSVIRKLKTEGDRLNGDQGTSGNKECGCQQEARKFWFSSGVTSKDLQVLVPIQP